MDAPDECGHNTSVDQHRSIRSPHSTANSADQGRNERTRRAVLILYIHHEYKNITLFEDFNRPVSRYSSSGELHVDDANSAADMYYSNHRRC